MNITVNIKSITESNKETKYIYAVEELAKALKVKSSLHVEHAEEPIPIVQSLIDEFDKEYDEALLGLVEGVAAHLSLRKAKSPFIFPKGIVYNPKTGEPITPQQWKTVTSAMRSYINLKTESIPQRMAMYTMAVGSLVNRLEKEKKIDEKTLKFKDLKNKLPKEINFKSIKTTFGQSYANTSQFRTDSIGTYLTDTNEKMLSGIKRILIDGMQHQKPVQEIEKALFNEYASKNRDWKRISKTETQNSFVDGKLASELIDTSEDESIYMIGVGSAKACSVCKRDVIGKIVRLLPKAPKGGDEYIDDPYTNVAIWVGKTSVGHGAKEHWSNATRHPACSCSWLRTYPEFINKKKEK